MSKLIIPRRDGKRLWTKMFIFRTDKPAKREKSVRYFNGVMYVTYKTKSV